jgi:hypothetical protein
MVRRIWRLGSQLICGILLLAACTGPNANIPSPTERPPSTQPAATASLSESYPLPATQVPTTAQSVGYPLPVTPPSTAVPATEPPAPTEGSVEPTAAPVSRSPLQGEVVLKLSAGAGPDQVGVYSGGDPAQFSGPQAFRIGADGTIRVLDNVNNRILFFGPDGKPARILDLGADIVPRDFIVNSQGEVFVFAGSGMNEIRHYSAKGKLLERLPVGFGVLADSIALTSAQDLLLISDNQFYWFIKHNGVVVPPKLQSVTEHEGIGTPRSPTLFQTVTGADGTVDLHVIGLTTSVSGDRMSEVVTVKTGLPDGARFFNVDRAMNLYFTQITPDHDAVDVWRVLPDGTTAGGAHILLDGCAFSWRTFYVDQAGTAWTLCVSAQGVTVTRYLLHDANGQPLPDTATEAADVAWKPGKRLDAA